MMDAKYRRRCWRSLVSTGVLIACQLALAANPQIIGTPQPPTYPEEPKALTGSLAAVIDHLQRGMDGADPSKIAAQFAMPISVMNSTPGVQTVYEAYNFRTTDGYIIRSIIFAADGRERLINTMADLSDKPCLSIDTVEELYPQGTTEMASLTEGASGSTQLRYYTQRTGYMAISFGFQRWGFGGASDKCITRLAVSVAHDWKS